jgi:lipoprotein-anchoring transpeptidase ErfK/SrfK
MTPPSRFARMVTFSAVLAVFAPASVHADSSTDTPVASDTSAGVAGTTTSVPLPPVSTVPAAYVPPVRQLPKVRIGSAVIVLDEQKVYVYSATRRLLITLPVSTGLDDSTPTGSFRVFSKSAQAYFTPNPGERMKWMVRFTKGRGGDNIGFHGIPYRVTSAGNIPIPTPVGVRAVSHGCIRTRDPEAKWLFDNMDIGTPVRVVQSRRG